MDTNNWSPTAAQGAEPSVETGGDWRTQLPTDARQRIVNKILETLNRHLPYSGPEGLEELKKVAVRFEEKIYTKATSQFDYLQKISLKMLTMESKSQTTIPNSLPPNPSGNNNRPSDSGEVCGNLMDTNNWRLIAVQGAEPSVETGGDWKTQLSSDSRNIIVNEIVETLKKIAVHREEKIYAAATSKSDYLLRIALEMLSMEYNSQNTIPNSLPPTPSGNNNNCIPPDAGAKLGSTAQTGHSNGGDWQEEVYQKIKAMKEMYLSELYEMYQIIALELQQHDPLQPLKMAEAMLERVIAFLQVPKSNILPSFKEKLGSYEEQITILIKVKKYIPPLQQGQLCQPHMQQTQSQVSQVQSHENQMNPQIQSVPNMQQNNMEGLQHTSLSSLSGVSTSQQNIMNSLQPASSLHSGQENPMGSLTQTAVGPLQQNTISALQQGNITKPSGLNMLQPNIHLQSNPNMLQDQHLKQQHRMQQLILQQQMLQRQRQHQQQLSQQQLMSHMQSQQIQLQQQLGLQQQPNQIQLDMQPGLQASIQAPGSLLQQQNVIDQQGPLPETSSTSLDSTAQTGNSIGGDWQEEVHQKIKAMKEMYLPELNEMHQKIALKLQQSDSLLQPPKSEQLEKLKLFKTMLERILAFLQVPKANIQPSFREKLGSYEKQIINFINSNKGRKPIPPHQQGQLGQPLMQQPQSQVQSLENQINPQIQSMSMQGSVPNMQHSSLSSLSGPSSLDSAVGPLQQITVSAPQQGNVTNFSSQSGVNMLQPNIPLQTNPNMLLKQQEQMLHSQKQCQMQHQILLQQMMQQQQQQQFNQQAKQQLPAQMQAHQMPQVHQMNDINELKIRQGMGVKPGVFQQNMSGGPRTPYTHQQLKSGASFPISSSQLLQAASPQLSQNSSTQIDQQNQLSSLFQSANSPSIVPSPLTMLAPSPIPGDSEEPVCGLSLLSNAGNIAQEQATVAQLPAPSFAIGTPEISRSFLLAEFVSDVRGHGSAMGTIASGKSSVTKQPPQRLISAVKSMSSEALSASVSGTNSVVGNGHSNGGDRQEEVLQEIKTLKELYLDELNEIHQEIASQFEQHDSPLSQPLNTPEMHEELDLFKLRL